MSTDDTERDSSAPVAPDRRDGRGPWRAWVWALVPVVIALLAWQPVALMPGSGLDLSWTAALQMAAHNGITFGNHAIFTYGPLGFLTFPALWYGSLGAASFAYNLLLRVALAGALFAGARRTFGTAVAFVIAVVIASVGDPLGEAVIALIVMAYAATADLPRRRALGLALASGALAGIELLNKVSVGITLAAMTTVFVLTLPGRRRDLVAAAAGGLVFTLLLCWVATGQDLAAFPDYVSNSIQIVSGYAAAMGLTVPGQGWESTAALFALAIGVWGALHTTASADIRQRTGLALLWLTFWFFAFKEGFVRHESGHASIFFGALLGGFLAFRWRSGHRLAALACTVALLTFVLDTQRVSLSTDLSPSRNFSAAINEIRDVASLSRRAAITAAGRAAIEGTEPIDARSLSLLRGHTVAVYPSEIALAWAYSLDWDPLPVLQAYSAYTATLDQVDSDYLTSRDAPQRILVQPLAGIDGRVQSFDQGMTSRTMLCRYKELYATARLAVLGLGANRCSVPTPLLTVHADWREPVSVPPPPNHYSLVLVRIGGVGIAGLERLKALLFRPAERFVVLNGGPPDRLVPGTAQDGMPLLASAGVDFTPPFNIAVGASTIAVLKQGQGPTGGDPITYSFYAQSLRSP